MPIQDLKGQMTRLPEQPGVYIYYNNAGDTLYVGKARVLRDRVRSYLGAQGLSPRHDALLREASRLETIVTDSVVEALALENHLIKQRAPKYNILLRDDKNYPYLQLTTGEAFPRVLVARSVGKDDHFYAGPFMPAKLGRRTMELTHRIFGIRSCNEVITGERARPCLEYDIKRCIAPCVREVCSAEDYTVAVQHTRLFLEGRNDELLEQLKRDMAEAAGDERFERAAQVRDAIRVIETLRQRQQKMTGTQLGDRDAFGLKVGPAGAVVQVFQVRGGKVLERVELASEAEGSRRDGGGATPDPDHRDRSFDSSEQEVLQAALEQFYEDREAPPEIHVPIELSPQDAEVLEAWLSNRSAHRVRVVVPKRGEKRGLLELAARNAQVAYQTRFNENVAAHYDALETLRVVLNLPAIPRRIDCFDISTIQGSETVASMVVCDDGRMKRSEYRKFRIRGAGASAPAAASGGGAPRALNNDFASMREVVLRRYRKTVESGGPFPDLILIDGGKGQLGVAYEALEELGLSRLVAAGLAKKEELLFTRDHDEPIALAADSPALLLIQRIRDEAHRFAITFHRASRARRDLTSELDRIAGVGPRRRNALLRTFGSLAGVRRANREELTAVVGSKCADAVLAHFANS
jgi:excinuclease ABC subunit C